MSFSWKFDAWKGLPEAIKHINKYTLLMAMCVIKSKNYNSFDNSTFRPFSEYVNYFEENILENKIIKEYQSDFIYEERSCKKIIKHMMGNEKQKILNNEKIELYKKFESTTNNTPDTYHTLVLFLKWAGMLSFIIFSVFLIPVSNTKNNYSDDFLIFPYNAFYTILPILGFITFIRCNHIDRCYKRKLKKEYSKLKYGVTFTDCLVGLENEFGYLQEHLAEQKSKYDNMTLEEKKREFFRLYDVPETIFNTLQNYHINNSAFLLPNFTLNSQIDFPLFITYLKSKSRNGRNRPALLYALFNIPKTKNISQYAREYSEQRKGKALIEFAKKLETEKIKFSLKSKN